MQQLQEGGEALDVIELTPENRANEVFKVRLKVRKKDTSVKSWQIFKKSGNQYTYNLSKFQPNPPMTVTTFAFDKAKYKGVKVVDLR